MGSTFFLWFQQFATNSGKAFEFLTSHPFKDIPELSALTPLMLISLSGLIIFIGVALVKWVLS